MRNRPIRQLIKWFVNREKGKVVEARSGIRRRFPYIDWSDQKIPFGITFIWSNRQNMGI